MGNKRITKLCTFCNKSITRHQSEFRYKNQFCNEECRDNYKSSYRIGENAPSWKGGLTKINNPEEKKIKRLMFELNIDRESAENLSKIDLSTKIKSLEYSVSNYF